MVKVIVYFIIISILFYSNYKQKGWKSPSGWLLFIYLISAFAAIFDVKVDGMKEIEGASYWLPMLGFTFFIVSFLYPYKRFRETDIQSIKLPSLNTLILFSNFIIAISFYTIIYYAGTVRNIFAMASLGDARNDLYAGELYTETGIMNTIASVGGSLYVFALLLFFIFISIGGHKKRAILLLISSISEPLHILTAVGRDGIVFWIFSFVFLYFLFNKFIEENVSKTIVKSFVIGVSLLMIPFIAISVSRFGAGEDKYEGTGDSMVAYMGQGPVYGITFFGIENKPQPSGDSFPLFYEITGIKKAPSQGMIRIGDWRSWAFSTFVVSLFCNIGLLGLLLALFFYMIIFRGNVKIRDGHFSLSRIVLYLLFFQILSQGVFYFKQYTRGGNLFILLCFILYFIFVMLENNGRNIVLSKKK